MKLGFVFLILGIIILIFLKFMLKHFIGLSFWIWPETVDVHVYDTKYVVNGFDFFTPIVLFLGTLFLIGAVLGTKLRNRTVLILLILMLAVDTYVVIRFIKLFSPAA